MWPLAISGVQRCPARLIGTRTIEGRQPWEAHMRDGIVIVGAGQAGARAAEELRKQGYAEAIRLIGSEPHLPYERPHLSKEYMLGREEIEAIFIHDERWYAEHSVELIQDTVVNADLSAKTVSMGTGARLAFESLLLTTGSEPRRLAVPGAELSGVLYLRTIEDARRIRISLKAGGRSVVIVGGGWIGLELAAAARTLGNDVTVMDAGDVVLGRALGPEAGGYFARAHRAHGVQLLMGEQLAGLEGAEGSVVGAVTASGRRLPLDVLIVGIGALPRTAVAESAALPVDNGIVVDAALRTGHPSVYAAGDVANAYHPLFERHIRVEHWDTARMMSRAAARSMVGQSVSYDRIPYFYTDQYDISMEYWGSVGRAGFDQFVWRGDPDDGSALGFWLQSGHVRAGMTINIPKMGKLIEALVRSNESIDVEALVDVDQSLESMLPAAESA